jgi:autotransporter-associated beta strand protein
MKARANIGLSIVKARLLGARLLCLTSTVLLLVVSSQATGFAGSATWKANPTSGDWNTAANWTPPTVPNGPADTATFAASNITGVSLSADTEVNGIAFNAGASAFTITVSASTSTSSQLTISGVGITNNSGIAQNFAITTVSNFVANLVFTNSATAGSGTFFTINRNPAAVWFFDASTAGNGTFTNSGGVARGGDGGGTIFLNGATADNGTFTINGGAVRGAHGGFVQFVHHSSAGNGSFTTSGGGARDADGGNVTFVNSTTGGNGTFTVNGAAVSGAHGGRIYFGGNSTAYAATIIANDGLGEGGLIFFTDGARGGRSRVAVFGNGGLDISAHDPGNVTIGSIEGDGNVFLGARNLTIGSNNLSTTFSGMIQDGGVAGGAGGSLTKIGSGNLVLSHRNTYTGGTIIERGKLMVNNTSDSGTGTGAVQVADGKVGGKGIIAGPVTVGAGNGSAAVLAPGYLHGANRPGTFTIQSLLTFNGEGIYQMELNSSSAMADEVAALGVVINAGARFSFADIGNSTLPIGTVFTIINNTSATPIAGAFSNLPDGSTFTSNGNAYQVSYEGGDGNDLTLTVVP